MGTTFNEIYTDWMMPIINDYKVDALYIKDKKVFNEFFKGFLQTGLSDFDCLKPLTYRKEIITDQETNEEEEIYIFDSDLDDDEKKIIGEIAVTKYWKRIFNDIKARSPYMSQREFKKEATAPVMKENDKWYNNLVSEYVADISNYHIKHMDELDYWKDLS